MKKVIFLSAFALVVLFGCAKEEATSASANKDVQNLEESTRSWVINSNDENPTYQAIRLDELQSNDNAGVVNRSNSAHAHGDYQYGSYGSIDFSGTMNNGGPHGSAEFQAVFPSGNLHIKMETANLVLLGEDENEAIYCGQISEVIENTLPVPPPPPPPPPGYDGPWPPPPPPPPYGLGSYFYFRVKDNGQGNNAPADQYHSAAFSTTVFIPNGGINLPWFFGSYRTVEEPGSIKVNN